MNKYIFLLILISIFCIFNDNSENFVIINSHLRNLEYVDYDLIKQETDENTCQYCLKCK